MRGEHRNQNIPRVQAHGSAPHARGTRLAGVHRPGGSRFSPACAGNTQANRPELTHRAVQPRMRGEHSGYQYRRRIFAGSAPHARGTHTSSGIVLSASRFSPACAGNTRCRAVRDTPRTVQPRMRGEHVNYAGHDMDWYRFSPACAGNTRLTPWPATRWTVQPRMRGEHILPPACRTAFTGSAPHARGTRADHPVVNPDDRFSPACAGNTSLAPSCPGLIYGSAPHARGTLPVILSAYPSERFSPACAGNTSKASLVDRQCPVQPRMRGEHLVAALVLVVFCGSAPHARGTRPGHQPTSAYRRFSPACAGNTRAPGQPWGGCTVQPRMRGEHCPIGKLGRSASGSAPHARGTRCRDGAGRCRLRFSPACAGNTPLGSPDR